MKSMVICALTLALGAAVLAHAADVSSPSDAAIAERQAGYDLQQGVIAAMKATVEAGGSVAPLEDGATGLAAWGHIIPSLFPPGTETGHDTKARPEIWSDSADFQRAAANYAAEADKLPALAKADDRDGFATQLKATVSACVVCHRHYRYR